MLFHLFIFSHMNCSIHSYSAGKLTIRMRPALCHTMSLIDKHARISENLGRPHALHVDRHFLVQFDMTDFS